jgi:type IV pilus modification protein PilV
MRQQRVRLGIQGFTLIEILVAMILFSIASLGTASVLTSTMRANMMAHHRSFATTLAQDRIEEVRASGTTACIGGSDSQGSVTFSLACATAAGPNGSTNVTVIVTWSYPSSQSVQLQLRI